MVIYIIIPSPSNTISVSLVIKSISLVIKLEKGTVYPQFHVNNDDFFDTVHTTSGNH